MTHEEFIRKVADGVSDIVNYGLEVKLSNSDIEFLSERFLKLASELVANEGLEAWDAALHHVWKLADPIHTVINTGRHIDGDDEEVLVKEDIIQAMHENPWILGK